MKCPLCKQEGFAMSFNSHGHVRCTSCKYPENKEVYQNEECSCRKN